MYDRVLVLTINSYYSKVPIVPVPRYYFSKVTSTGTAVLLRSTVPTSGILQLLIARIYDVFDGF